MRQNGILSVWRRVSGQKNAGVASGYSSAGKVLEVGPGVKNLRLGQRVACAGAGFASHAEFIVVPENLAVPVPAGVSSADAATVALGAISLHGIRRANPTLGENFVVLGLGLIGQLTCQILRAAGCHVWAHDPDPGREALAGVGSRCRILPRAFSEWEAWVGRATDGAGADGVIITAGAPHDHVVIRRAMALCRKKGRVVIVGDVGLHLERASFYAKELDVLISCSYGPGRYDSAYELDGQDYPLPYVRWTENRNMGEYLKMIQGKQISLVGLSRKVVQFHSAPQAFLEGRRAGTGKVLTLFAYSKSRAKPRRLIHRIVPASQVKKTGPGPTRLAVAGLGGFAQAVHLPLLRSMPDLFRLQLGCGRSAQNLNACSRRFPFHKLATDFEEVLEDDTVDAVLICTRHHLHADWALRALAAGKHVLCEKPLALKSAELDCLEKFFHRNARPPVLLTGFNRRWSPLVQKLREAMEKRQGPVQILYRMNAGPLPEDHWVKGPEGGGRNLGEACHIYDLFVSLLGADVRSVRVTSSSAEADPLSERSENFSATLGFGDGSSGTLLYTSRGNLGLPKERLEAFWDHRAATLDDFRSLRFFGEGRSLRFWTAQKGHREQWQEFSRLIRGTPSADLLGQQLLATRLTLKVQAKINQTDSPD